MFSLYGKRKFVVTMTALVLATALALFERLTGDFAMIASASVVGYHVANAVVARVNGS